MWNQEQDKKLKPKMRNSPISQISYRSCSNWKQQRFRDKTYYNQHFKNTLQITAADIKGNKLDKDELDALLAENKAILIADLNARHPDWENSVENNNELRLKQLIEHTDFLFYYPNIPTRYWFNDKTHSTKT